MSNAEHEPTNLPIAGEPFKPLGYFISIKFQMPIQLVTKRGLAFASKLSPAFDPREMDLQDNQWNFNQKIGDKASGFFRVRVEAEDIAIEVGHTDHRLQWFTDRCGPIIDEFRKMFTPVIVIGTMIRVNGTISIDGDSRLFLSEHVAHFNRSRLNVFNRPVQLFGIRLAMPPYQFQVPPKRPVKKGSKKKVAVETVDWHVEAKAESWLLDPSKLYLETATAWQKPIAWDDKTTDLHIQRLEEVSEFLQTKLIPCLTNPEN